MPSPEPMLRRTQTERRQDAERRLLESAIELIGSKGVRGMTLSEVGVRAGYSRGLVSHHYGSRDAFLVAVARHLHQRFVDAERRSTTEPGLPTLLANVALYLSGSEASARAFNVMLTESIVARGELRDEMRRISELARRFYAHHIRIGIECGQIRAGIEPEMRATVILGLLRGTAAQTLIDEQMRRRHAALRDEVNTAIRALLDP